MPEENKKVPVKRRQRHQWHLLYYVLAAFNILTVFLSLRFIHQVQGNFSQLVESGAQSQARIKEFAALFELAIRIKSPVDDVFESGTVEDERGRMLASQSLFDESFRMALKRVKLETEPADARPLMEEVIQAKEVVKGIVAEAEKFFDNYGRVSASESGKHQARIDRRMKSFYDILANINLIISSIQNRMLDRELDSMARIRAMEFVIGALVLVMVVGAIFYGRHITQRMNEDAEDLDRAQRELLETARRAGMAEIATGVLHNVGNVLNSINVSATLVSDQLRKSKIGSVTKVAELFEQNADRLGEFISVDPKGKQIPGFVKDLGEHLKSEQAKMGEEMGSLTEGLEHVKTIISMQQSYAKVAGVSETLPVVDIIEDAFRLNAVSFVRHDIKIAKDYEIKPTITIERHKMLQILVNLMRNSKEAMDKTDDGRQKQLTVRVCANDDSSIKVIVKDNGIGISPENLTRIFQHGFTTRKEGHGFGLHSGALAAKEMGGRLSVDSEGELKGATFTLELPFKSPPVES